MCFILRAGTLATQRKPERKQTQGSAANLIGYESVGANVRRVDGPAFQLALVSQAGVVEHA